MGKSIAGLGKAEWAVMQALWNRSRGTASELQRDLAEDHGWAYSTVKTMLDRLVEKGYAKTRRVGNVYEYSPKVRRQSAVSRVVDDMVERVLEGAWAPLVSRLISQRRLSSQEIAELRAMLDQYQDEADA
jgi:BlaI family penicillinase repressor